MKTIAHHQLPNDQLTKALSSGPLPNFPPVLLLICGMEYSCDQLGPAVPAMPPAKFSCTSTLLAGRCGKQKRLQLCVNTAQQKLK